jgi:hypothetical protein
MFQLDKRRTASTVCFAIVIAVAWAASYQWYVIVWIASTHKAALLESRRGDFELRLETHSVGYPVESRFIGFDVEPVGAWENNYELRQWQWHGFGFGADVLDGDYPELHHSIIGFPYWFLVLASLVVSPLAMSIFTRVAAARSIGEDSPSEPLR